MATVIKAMVKELRDDTTVAGLVSARVHSETVPTGNVLPYIVLQDIDRVGMHTLAAPSGFATSRIQVDVWAANPDSRATVDDAVRETLDGFPRGTLGSGTMTAEVQNVRLDIQISSEEEPTVGNEKLLYRRQMDFMVTHVETVPTFV